MTLVCLPKRNGDKMTSLYMNNRACGENQSSGSTGLHLAGWLLGGLGIGAMVMYLLDPEAGSERRESLYRMAGQARDQIGKIGSSIKEAANVDSMSDIPDRIAELLPAKQEEESSSVLPTIATAVSCCLVGAAVMYLLDPDSGRRRRAVVRDKAYSSAHRAGKMVANKGKHLRNRAQGMVHDAARMAQENSPFNRGNSEHTYNPQ